VSKQTGKPIEIEHTTARVLTGPVSAAYRRGVPLGELLEWITDLQANGVPDDADVLVQSGSATATWRDQP
jgi:hypothetical protein